MSRPIKEITSVVVHKPQSVLPTEISQRLLLGRLALGPADTKGPHCTLRV